MMSRLLSLQLLFVTWACSIKHKMPGFITVDIYNNHNFLKAAPSDNIKMPIIALLNFKCYLNNKGFDKTIEAIQRINVPKNIKLLLSPPNIYLNRFTEYLSTGKYELCGQDVSTLRGYGAFTGETTAEMLKDFGVTWCLVGHPEFNLAHPVDDEKAYSRNATKLINSMEAGISPILILSGNEYISCCKQNSGNIKNPTCCKQKRLSPEQLDSGMISGNNFNVEAEVTSLVDKVEIYCKMLREQYPLKKLHLYIGYEPKKSIGSGIPTDSKIVKEVITGLHSWCVKRKIVDVTLSVLYGGSLTASTGKEYLGVGCDGVLFGKCSASVDIQSLVDSLSQCTIGQ